MTLRESFSYQKNNILIQARGFFWQTIKNDIFQWLIRNKRERVKHKLSIIGFEISYNFQSIARQCLLEGLQVKAKK